MGKAGVVVLHDPMDGLQEFLPVIVEEDAVSPVVEDGKSQFLFHEFYCPGQGGLGYIQPFGGFGKTAAFRYDGEGMEGIEVHGYGSFEIKNTVFIPVV